MFYETKIKLQKVATLVNNHIYINIYNYAHTPNGTGMHMELLYEEMMVGRYQSDVLQPRP